jgi:hypothetical protein
MILKIKLDAVACNHCDLISDFDFFKNFDYKQGRFLCQNCLGPYQTTSIECKIIEWLNSLIAFIGVQDLYCVNTSQPRQDSLTLYTETGAEYREKPYPFMKEFMLEIKNKFTQLALIARSGSMRNLEAYVSQLIF